MSTPKAKLSSEENGNEQESNADFIVMCRQIHLVAGGRCKGHFRVVEVWKREYPNFCITIREHRAINWSREVCIIKSVKNKNENLKSNQNLTLPIISLFHNTALNFFSVFNTSFHPSPVGSGPTVGGSLSTPTILNSFSVEGCVEGGIYRLPHVLLTQENN